MLRQTAMVETFMRKVGGSFPTPISEESKLMSSKLKTTAKHLLNMSRGMLEHWKSTNDRRVFRLYLIMEEFGELMLAMSSCDEAAVLDGLADLAYVVIGTAVQFDLPLGEAFDEVHRSNMTKDSAKECRGESGNGKGPSYSPPNMAELLKYWRLFKRLSKADVVWVEDDARPADRELNGEGFVRIFNRPWPKDAQHASWDDSTIVDCNDGALAVLCPEGWTLYKERA